MILQIELLDGSVTEITQSFLRDAFNPCKVENIFLNRHVVEDCVSLRAVANQLLDIVKVFSDVEVSDVDASLGRLYLTCQALESSRLSSTIDT